MSKNFKKNTSIPEPIAKTYTAEGFLKEYQELCKKTGFNIAFEPRWAQSKDQGDYRLVIMTVIAPLPKDA